MFGTPIISDFFISSIWNAWTKIDNIYVLTSYLHIPFHFLCLFSCSLKIINIYCFHASVSHIKFLTKLNFSKYRSYQYHPYLPFFSLREEETRDFLAHNIFTFRNGWFELLVISTDFLNIYIEYSNRFIYIAILFTFCSMLP